MERTVDEMKSALPCYRRITNGHGSGAEYIMEAEMFFNRGERVPAEILMFKAFDAASPNYLAGISLCASFLQMRMALWDGNLENLFSIMRRTRDEALEKGAYMFLHTLDMCESWIFSLIDDVDACAGWLSDDDKTRLLSPAIPAANMVRGQIMLVRKQYLRLISLEERFLAMSEVFPNLLAKLYLFIQLSAAYDNISQSELSRKYMDMALEIALPDKLYMPFAENAHHITLPKDIPQKILNLSSEFLFTRKKMTEMGFAKQQLSLREKQIAMLVAAGKSNKQIGNELGVAENTVKVIMKSIFRKTAVKNRVELSKLF